MPIEKRRNIYARIFDFSFLCENSDKKDASIDDTIDEHPHRHHHGDESVSKQKLEITPTCGMHLPVIHLKVIRIAASMHIGANQLHTSMNEY